MKTKASKTRAERDVEERVRSLDVDVTAMAAVSNIFRVANAIRNHTERTLLDRHNLTFTGFTVLWVLWIWGQQESHELARESGISKSTLTGVVKTLEKLELVERAAHPLDGRRVYVRTTRKGQATMRKLFPQFNRAEAEFTAELTQAHRKALVAALRTMLGTLEDLA